MSNANNGTAASPLALRHTFVSMLFALTIAEVAIQASGLASLAARSSDANALIPELTRAFSRDNWLLLAPLSHLLLGFALICTSWVGWSRSIRKSAADDVEDIFSLPFVLLIVELLLLVLYFLLLRSVEIGNQFPEPSPTAHESTYSPSAAPEALWLMAVYIIYALWDLLNDALPRHLPKDRRPIQSMPFVSATVVFISGLLTRSLASVICAVLAWVVYRHAASLDETSISAFWGDMALMCVVIGFWLAKVLEPTLVQNFFPWEQYRKKGGNDSDKHRSRLFFFVIVILVYVICLIMM